MMTYNQCEKKTGAQVAARRCWELGAGAGFGQFPQVVGLVGVFNVVLRSYGGFSGLHQQYNLNFSIEKRKQEYRMSLTEYLNIKVLQENRFDQGRRVTNMWLWQKGISSSFNQSS